MTFVRSSCFFYVVGLFPEYNYTIDVFSYQYDSYCGFTLQSPDLM